MWFVFTVFAFIVSAILDASFDGRLQSILSSRLSKRAKNALRQIEMLKRRPIYH